ncbi:hypothetical protein SAMN06265360_106135 [Haloechinothrix alba]|uniref:Peroxide stress protein YaaA n=1 Tax=Haloechinothrix alba TaxID=664784 RepID=A0A238WFW9_9PSEU|nr:peroxide stress protein YaaA [Haloechinothrix alba]SNR45480.1 hypothetical protein SAMN06265360_106135 [Haloechinothrix alba]
MLVLLPPSETKAHGGDGPPLDLAALSFPELTDTRKRVVDSLVDLAGDVEASRATLGLSERQDAEIERNAALWSSPTMPALSRYTGVLYDAMGLDTFGPAERARARERLAVASALFGLVGAEDPIPAYRLSGGSSVPGLGSLRGLWRPNLEPVLAGLGSSVLVDLRSGPYAALARVPSAVTVRVVTDDGTGARTTVSHHNKAYKGRLAGALVRARQDASTVDDVVGIAAAAGVKIEQTGERTLEVLTD